MTQESPILGLWLRDGSILTIFRRVDGSFTQLNFEHTYAVVELLSDIYKLRMLMQELLRFIENAEGNCRGKVVFCIPGNAPCKVRLLLETVSTEIGLSCGKILTISTAIACGINTPGMNDRRLIIVSEANGFSGVGLYELGDGIVDTFYAISASANAIQTANKQFPSEIFYYNNSGSDNRKSILSSSDIISSATVLTQADVIKGIKASIALITKEGNGTVLVDVIPYNLYLIINGIRHCIVGADTSYPHCVNCGKILPTNVGENYVEIMLCEEMLPGNIEIIGDCSFSAAEYYAAYSAGRTKMDINGGCDISICGKKFVLSGSKATGEQFSSSTQSNVNIEELLAVLDNLSFAISYSDSISPDFITGLNHICNQLQASLEKAGIQIYGKCGELFDPSIHNAVGHIYDATLPKNSIYKVVKHGYSQNEKMALYAKVIVAN